MSKLNRRSFLAAAGALVAAPVLGIAQDSGEVDVVIIGAGAAGIAAARRVAAANRRFTLIETGNRVGGRCVTDSKVFGVPYDLGAHWIENPASNPLVDAAPKSGLDIDPAATAQSVRVGARAPRDSELEGFLAAQARARGALTEAGRGKTDVAAATALPRDLGDWQEAVEFMLGPFGCGTDLKDVSAIDLARATKREGDASCRQGYGALLATLAADLSPRLSTTVQRIEWGESLEIETTRGALTARTAILTVSTNVLAANKIEFSPELPERQRAAAANLALGSYDHVALEMPGNPLGLQRDALVFEQSSGPRTAALIANVSGTPLHLVEVAGQFGRELSAKGQPAMVDFAGEWLASQFGSDVKKAIKRSHATRWNEEPFVLGAMSAAAPGSADARKVLMETMEGRIWFAGEAAHETQWGTVNGAWESGVRAAEAALRKLGALDADDEKAARGNRQQPNVLKAMEYR